MKNKYEKRGNVTVIFLKRSNGEILETFIDTSDLFLINSFKGSWYAHLDKTSNDFYVYIGLSTGCKKTTMQLHRVVVNAKIGMVVDHKNHNTLDNTKNNLREVTQAVNRQNLKGANINSKTGIRGVTYDKNKNSWRAEVMLNGKFVYRKRFNNIKEAEQAVIEARAKYYIAI